MYERFTDRARKVMQLANQEAQRFNHEYIGTEHILLGLAKEGSGLAVQALRELGVDLGNIVHDVEKIVQRGPEVVTTGRLPQTVRAKKVIERAIEECRALDHQRVGTEHLLLGLLREQEGVAAQVLMNRGVRLDVVRERVAQLAVQHGEAPAGPRSKTPALDKFGSDLTAQARQGKLEPVLFREEELERLLAVLGCRAQNNAVLVGQPGVGKSAVVRALAQRLTDAEVPEVVQGRRVVAFHPSGMFMLDQSRMPQALEAMLNESRRARNVLLFIEDVAVLAAPVGEAVGGYTTVLRSQLVRGDVQCITAATPRQYDTLVAADALLARHFQPVLVRPLSREQTLDVLRGIRPDYEAHHGVSITDDALRAAVELSDQYWADRGLPGKALQLLDQAAMLLRLRMPPRPPALQKLVADVDRRNAEKERAVAECDFEKAARLRDQADRLKKDYEGLLRDWQENRKKAVGPLDKELVEEMIHGITGRPPEPA